MESPPTNAPLTRLPAASRPPKRWIRWTAVVLAVAGWWLSLDLTRISAGAAATNPWLQAACGQPPNGSSIPDCLSVVHSQWGYVSLSKEPGGLKLPVSTFGMAYFAFVGLWYVFVGPPTRSRAAWHLVVAAVGAVGAVYSAYFVHVMAFVLRRWCEGCVAAHVANAGLLALTILAWPWRRPPAATLPFPSARLALATGSACVAVWLLHPLFVILLITGQTSRQLDEAYRKIVTDPAYVVWEYRRQPVIEIPLHTDEPFAGDAGAPSTVIVYSDFQCPACRTAEQTLAEVLGKYPGKLRVAYRNFPQDPACNPKFKTGGHPAACRAARAAEAARVGGGARAYLRMRALLFDRQTGLESDTYALWAAELGLDRAAFDAAFNSPAVAERVRADVELGLRLGLETVPAIFLDGRRFDHWRNLDAWATLLAGERDALTAP